MNGRAKGSDGSGGEMWVRRNIKRVKRKIINKVSGVGESRSVGVERVASEVLYVLIAVRLFFSDATPPACVRKRVREGCYMREEEIADEKLKCVSIKIEEGAFA